MSLSATWILLAVFLSGGKEVNRFVKHTAVCHNAVEAHWCACVNWSKRQSLIAGHLTVKGLHQLHYN